jgi:glycosyltransferase involved in cell wall biosynthesis
MILSIIVVNYNSGTALERTFHFLKRLVGHPQIELIVIDGGSNDESSNIINSYRNRIEKYINEPDGGIYDAMNKGIRISTGKWIWFVNAGDVPLIDSAVCMELINAAENNNCNYIF